MAKGFCSDDVYADDFDDYHSSYEASIYFHDVTIMQCIFYSILV